jgi:transposase
MLKDDQFAPLTEAERQLYTQLVPQDHFLRRLLEQIDFERFRPTLNACYDSDHGRPSWDPVAMLKLEILTRHYGLSDREVIAQTRVNVAYRLFVGLGLQSALPHHTLLTYFRQRVGPERMQEIFHALLGQARELGLVRDRLRLKDATHIIANIAVPSTIRLVSQTREQLLEALRPFAPVRVVDEEQRAEAIRTASEDLKDEERLVRRVAHVRAILAWADEIPGQPVFVEAQAEQQQKLRAALALAHKVLADRADPDAPDKVRSVHDPDARRGRHGKFYDGYLYDVAMDADSELITGINVLPANGNEGADATHLIRQEEEAHGNDVQGMSIDGAGYQGKVLRELTDPQGLNLEVFVPPSERPAPAVFGPEQFTLSDDGTTVTCPAGHTSQYRHRAHERQGSGTMFRFAPSACASCPLRAQCLANPTTKSRQVIKNDYEAEYRTAKAKAQTAEYAQVRREHPAIERKLSELARRHDMRHARYRGQGWVLRQGLLTALVVNLKRIVRLLWDRVAQALGPPGAQTVRAELVGQG